MATTIQTQSKNKTSNITFTPTERLTPELSSSLNDSMLGEFIDVVKDGFGELVSVPEEEVKYLATVLMKESSELMKNVFLSMIERIADDTGLSDMLNSDEISKLLIASLTDQGISQDMAKILSQNLSKGINLFMEELYNNTKENRDKLIELAEDSAFDFTGAFSKGAVKGVVTAANELPPVAALNELAILAETGLGATQSVVKGLTVPLQLWTKTIESLSDKFNATGIPETLDTLNTIQKSAQIYSQAPQRATQYLRNSLDQQVQKTQQKAQQATDTALRKVTQPITKSLTPRSRQLGGKKKPLKSILKTAKKKIRHNKTKKVRFSHK